jgi:hypothetical protein
MAFVYKASVSPCHPVTDATETVVTQQPTGEDRTYCFDSTGYVTGPTSASELEEKEGSGIREKCPRAPAKPTRNSAKQTANSKKPDRKTLKTSAGDSRASRLSLPRHSDAFRTGLALPRKVTGSRA